LPTTLHVPPTRAFTESRALDPAGPATALTGTLPRVLSSFTTGATVAATLAGVGAGGGGIGVATASMWTRSEVTLITGLSSASAIRTANSTDV
jgi:precorrin-6B methylase 2